MGQGLLLNLKTSGRTGSTFLDFYKISSKKGFLEFCCGTPEVNFSQLILDSQTLIKVGYRFIRVNHKSFSSGKSLNVSEKLEVDLFKRAKNSKTHPNKMFEKFPK